MKFYVICWLFLNLLHYFVNVPAISFFTLHFQTDTNPFLLLELRFVVLGMDFVVIHFTVFNKWKKPLYLESNSCI